MLIGFYHVMFDLMFATSEPKICNAILVLLKVGGPLCMIFFPNVPKYFTYPGAPNLWCSSFANSAFASSRLVKFCLLADTKVRNDYLLIFC